MDRVDLAAGHLHHVHVQVPGRLKVEDGEAGGEHPISRDEPCSASIGRGTDHTALQLLSRSQSAAHRVSRRKTQAGLRKGCVSGDAGFVRAAQKRLTSRGKWLFDDLAFQPPRDRAPRMLSRSRGGTHLSAVGIRLSKAGSGIGSGTWASSFEEARKALEAGDIAWEWFA